MFMIIFSIILCLIWLVFLLNTEINKYFFNEIYSIPKIRDPLPLVSVLIPARNEEKNIENCVVSIIKQKYANFEVIVLNDKSTDNTQKILLELKRRYPKLQILLGQKLPFNWVGKYWACHQLSKKAKGKYFLFLDADTIQSPELLISLVSAAEQKNLDFVSLLPEEVTGTWFEKIVLPIIPIFIFGLIPVYIAYIFKKEYFAMAVGQVLFFRKDIYKKIGGFEVIRTELLDDVTFARMFTRYGLNWRLYNGAKLLSCRMYHNFEEVLFGFSKNAYPFFNCHLLAFLILVCVILAVFFGPIVTFVYTTFNFNLFTFGFSAISLIILYFIYATLFSNFKIKQRYFFLFPISILSWLGIVANSYYTFKTSLCGPIGRSFYDRQRK